MKRTDALLCLLLAGCATTSGVMESTDGTYLISARAGAARGGAAGANAVAYEEAQKFCTAKAKRAVVVGQADRDVYQSASAASQYGAAGGSAAAGVTNLRFRCE